MRAESSHELSQFQLKLGSFKNQVKLAQTRLARIRVESELSHEPNFFLWRPIDNAEENSKNL
jgi:hypothetical protein